jgi:hypothetical protein
MSTAILIGLSVLMTCVQTKPDHPQHKKPAPAPAAKAAAAHVEPFNGDFAAAKASAKERNVPILVHIVIEGEAQNDEYRDKILPDGDLAAACANVIVLMANNGKHAPKTVESIVDGRKVSREVCSAYGVASCALHLKCWDQIYAEFKQDTGELYCPQTIVLTPDGKVATRINTRSVPQVSEVVAAVKDAQQEAGPGLTEAQLIEVKRLEHEGQALLESKSWPDAARTWQKVLAITTAKGGPRAEAAQRNSNAAEDGLTHAFESVSERLVPGQAAEAYRELTDLEKACAGLAIEKDIKARLAKAETTKGVREEIATYKLGLEADAMLHDAQALFDQKQDKRGEHLVRRLFAKRFASTAAAAKARELWPDWAKEEDAKTNKP